MRRLLVLAAVAALILVALPLAPAGAASPFEDVTIEVDTSFLDGVGFQGPFTATGDAVDEGLICAEGWTVDVGAKAAPREGSPAGINIQLFKAFICGEFAELPPPSPDLDGFIVKMQIRIDEKKGNRSSWVVAAGFGLYEDLKGNGKHVGEFQDEGVLDTFTGKVR